jgi:glycosyltransferase involved in cell wall biosynthesis
LKTICIFTQSPLVTAPRVVKEANVYAHASHRVIVYSLWYDAQLLEKDRKLLHESVCYKAGVDLLNYGGFISKYIRVKRKLARLFVKLTGVSSVTALGYDFTSYLEKLLVEDADLYIGHEEMSMALCRALIKKGKNVAFDFEDWHSKDLLPKDRLYRPINLLENLEYFLLTKATYTYTTSNALATAMATVYGATSPKVVYNSFLSSEREDIDQLSKDRHNKSKPSLYWFSQVISEGRGLELLCESLQFTTTPLDLHLRGRISEPYHNTLKTLLPSHVSLFIHEVVPAQELISRIAEHDIGIAFEETTPESRDYTITNKVFHYLQAGIAILATNSQGQAEIKALAPDAVCLIDRDPQHIATTIELLLNKPQKLKDMKTASWQAGQEVFAFENEALKLNGFVNAM